jgi:hypothetical protein
MLQAWLSIGYIVLLAIVVLAFIFMAQAAPVLAIAALVVGIPLWFAWEYARPTWTEGHFRVAILRDLHLKGMATGKPLMLGAQIT